ncbi:arginyl-tRNA--protein transferase [Sulfurospirillum diekertiae]|uniref:Aspartate/glutamate leucyltransferase n=1 Tax=Sulfurospirillum diekertiae TaxID=1854492 RepID=A0A290HSI1_9BACT|nr:arginyltransferase [Sulfurospirillum diekertiae]ATB69594.1 arginyl-tRNA--protein transferase [Sulfurospirillum diekertiae]QIR77239.1 arginyltransferase [Sulfurospirillum diekertiae]
MRSFSRIIEFSTLETKCSYLDDCKTRMEYKYIENATMELNQELIERGWRRFGNYYSRPQCQKCKLCLSLRIDVKNYNFSRSAKRVFKKAEGIRYVIQAPTISTEHLELYDKYHRHMEQKRGWQYYNLKPQSYHELYVSGAHNFGKEVLYFQGEKLIGVDLIDFLDDGISSIYFYYDPDFEKLSLGRLSIYEQIILAKEYDLEWIYLGYYVKECQSLKYKASYAPYQTLQGNPNLDEDAIWI